MLAYNDPRLTAPRESTGERRQVWVERAALLKHPDAGSVQVSQVLFGEVVTLLRTDGRYGWVQNETDRYIGWVDLDALSEEIYEATHRIVCARVHAYASPGITSAATLSLGLGARLSATGETEGRYVEFEQVGWIVDHLLAPMDRFESDPAGVALRYIETPYLWGGRDANGLDCSGLVQMSFDACGVRCPRDSDMQSEWFGADLPDWQSAGALQRNDLIFWDGHVGIMLDAETILHANGTLMTVTREPLSQAIERIAKDYGEPVGARRINVSAMQGVKPDWLTAKA